MSTDAVNEDAPDLLTVGKDLTRAVESLGTDLQEGIILHTHDWEDLITRTTRALESIADSLSSIERVLSRSNLL